MPAVRRLLAVQAALGVWLLLKLFTFRKVKANGKWAVVGTWEPEAKPALEDECEVQEGKSVEVAATGKARSLIVNGTLSGTGELTIGDATAPTEAAFVGVALKIAPAATWTHTGVLNFLSTSATWLGIWTGGKKLKNVGWEFTKGGKWRLEEDFSIDPADQLTVNAGTLDSNTKKVEAGNVKVAGTATLTGTSSTFVVNNENGTVWSIAETATFTGTGSTVEVASAGTAAKTFAGGAKTYPTVTVTAFNVTVTGANTFTTLNVNNKGAAASQGLRLTKAVTQTVTTIAFNGTAGSKSRLESTVEKEPATLKVPGDLEATGYVIVRDINVEGGVLYLPNGEGPEGGNTNIKFEAKPSVGLKGSIAGTATLAGKPQAPGVAKGSIVGAATLTGRGSAVGVLRGALAGAATLTGRAGAAGVLRGPLAGVAALAGRLQAGGGLRGVLAGVSTLAGRGNAPGSLRGQLAGVMQGFARGNAPGSLRGGLAGVSTWTGRAQGLGRLAGKFGGVSIVKGAAQAAGNLAGSIAGVGSLIGRLLGSANLRGRLEGVSTWIIHVAKPPEHFPVHVEWEVVGLVGGNVRVERTLDVAAELVPGADVNIELVEAQ